MCIDFTTEEWALVGPTQEDLCRGVRLETDRTLATEEVISESSNPSNKQIVAVKPVLLRYML